MSETKESKIDAINEKIFTAKNWRSEYFRECQMGAVKESDIEIQELERQKREIENG